MEGVLVSFLIVVLLCVIAVVLRLFSIMGYGPGLPYGPRYRGIM